ncbi:MAG TPA: DMT family transporter [Stellaceae bacterium]|nr:DMT family transporter [Stellaceae bacterium]
MTTDAPSPRQNDALRAILLMCLGVSMFPFLNAGIKLLTAHYSVIEIVWARFAGHLLTMLIVFLPSRGWQIFRTHQPAIQITRSFLLLASTAFSVSGIGLVPLATASTIGFSSPIIVTALSVPLLGESVGPRRWSAVLVGFVGVLIVVRPGSSQLSAATLLLLGAAASYALYQIATRRSGVRDSAETGIVYAALVGTLAASLLVPFGFEMPRSLADAAILASLGMFGSVGHYYIIHAFRLGPAALVSPLGYLELVGSTTLGYVIFDNLPDLWTWAGASLIVASGIYIALREQRRRRY